jgi:hypothetical protein
MTALLYYGFEMLIYGSKCVIIRLVMANFDRLVKNLCAPAPLCHYRRQATDYFSELSHSFIAFHRF